jgi:hypothetical protein
MIAAATSDQLGLPSIVGEREREVLQPWRGLRGGGPLGLQKDHSGPQVRVGWNVGTLRVGSTMNHPVEI